MQLATKLAIGLGALFLVGVLLASIPNHRAPVVGASAEPGQEAQGTDHSTVPGMNRDEAKSNEKDAVHDMAHMHHGESAQIHVTAPKTRGSTR
jgi:hypothetical protein